MNPSTDVTDVESKTWRELDWIAGRTLESPSCDWIPVEIDEDWRKARPLGERIGGLKHAWIGTPKVAWREGERRLDNEAMEHWVQVRHEGTRRCGITEAYCRRVEGEVRVYSTLAQCLAGEGGTPLEEARLYRPYQNGLDRLVDWLIEVESEDQ